MRTKGLILALGAALVLLAGSAFAQGNSGCSGTIQGGAGSTACNAYGLCKAYFAGSANGQSHKHNAPPFVDLVNAACGDQSNSSCNSGECACATDGGSCETVDQCVASFCPDTNPAGKGRNPSDGSPGQHK